MPRMAWKVLFLVLILVLSLGWYGVRRLRQGPELQSETVTVIGLEEPVEVIYDSMGVPHIFASSMDDLFLAQGYVHATHRLWQMEMFRRVLQGRLSEIFGGATLTTDRFLRTIGMEEAARRGLPPTDSPVYRQMEHYARGVNAAVDGWRGWLPPELVLLRFHPEAWEPYMSQGIEKIMAWDLSDYQTGLQLAAAREVLGDSALAPLMPTYPAWGVTIVDGWPQDEGDGGRDRPESGDVAGQGGSAAPMERLTLPPPTFSQLVEGALLPQEVAGILELGSAVRASNSWVVGGERSRSGKPLVANDMHLGMNAPNIWFLVGLHAPGYDVVGMSIPGAPGIVAGHSKAVAWGYTNAMVDDADFFVERINPDDTTQYLTPDGWASFDTREEVIQLRGGNSDTLVVRSTRHGPVITPVEDRAGDEILAFQWVAFEPAGTFQALLGMAQARSVHEFLQAMRSFDDPHQNVVFADTAGAWGYWMGGRVPIRASGRPPQLPVPGWTGEYDWTGWVPFEEKPHVLSPPRGYVATANNAQGRDEMARRVTDGGWFGPYRAQRISELIESQELHDAGSLLAIQMNVTSAFVDRHLDRAVEAFQEAGLGDLADRLMSWDREATLESTEATLFHAWWVELRRALQRAYYGDSVGYFPDRVLEGALDGTLNVDLPPELPLEAARAASRYADLPWGKAHQLTLDHPLASVPLVGKLLRFGRKGIPRAGGPYSVNVGPLTGSAPPFEVVWGPSQRHVVDLADLDGSGGFILPGGESGYPDNRHSFDQLEHWLDGELWLLPVNPDGPRGRAEMETRAEARTLLDPGGG